MNFNAKTNKFFIYPKKKKSNVSLSLLCNVDNTKRGVFFAQNKNQKTKRKEKSTQFRFHWLFGSFLLIFGSQKRFYFPIIITKFDIVQFIAALKKEEKNKWNTYFSIKLCVCKRWVSIGFRTMELKKKEQ